MDAATVAKLEDHFRLRFPDAYRSVLMDCPLGYEAGELCLDANMLIASNEGCRNEDPWELGWRKNLWWIGDDGSGGFYFINCDEHDSHVYYFDHEVPPDSLDDVQALKPTPLHAFVSALLDSETRFNEACDALQNKITNRKWWQFWIPGKHPKREMRHPDGGGTQ